MRGMRDSSSSVAYPNIIPWGKGRGRGVRVGERGTSRVGGDGVIRVRVGI